MKKALMVCLSFVTALYATAANAASWTLVEDASRVSFVSVKAETVAEIHHFTAVEGGVSEAGEAYVRLPLAGVETAIDIRNERMQEFLFEVVKFPAATISTNLNLADYDTLKLGSRSLVTLSASLDLHGVRSDLEFDVFVTRIAEDKVAVDTVAPILLDADEFELGTGLDKLKELASLDMISPIVPVTASLVFTR